MRLQIVILCVLSSLALTSQGDREKQQLTTQEYDWPGEFYSNTTIPPDFGETSAPCSINVPGLNTLGLMITYIIVFIFSIMGNSVVVYVIGCMKKRRASTDIYLMHLALADLIFSVTLPFWAVKTLSGWIFGNFLCKLLSCFQEASLYSGVFLLVCISVDRYCAIVRATRVMSSNQLFVKVVCGVVWLVAGALSLPVAIQRESLQAEDLGRSICYDNLIGESSDRLRVSMHVLRHMLGFFVPLLVMAVCYGWTMVTLFHTRNHQKHKAMRVILAVVLAFIVCWLPYNIAVLIDTLIRGRSLVAGTCQTLYTVERMVHVTQVLAFMHCAVNPVLYAFIGEKFRNQLLAALYKHGVISKRIQMAYRKGSANSVGSTRSRNTSVTM